MGFAPRKTNITFYFSCYLEKEKDLLDKLGKYKAGKGCLYVKRLSDIDVKILRQIIERNKDGSWNK